MGQVQVKPRQPWLQFNLRAMLLFTTLAGVGWWYVLRLPRTLDPSSVRFEYVPPINRPWYPADLATAPYSIPGIDAARMYEFARERNFRYPYELIGKVPGEHTWRNRFEVQSFSYRPGSMDLLVTPANADFFADLYTDVYFFVPIPDELPPGEYTATVRFEGFDPPLESLTCRFTKRVPRALENP